MFAGWPIIHPRPSNSRGCATPTRSHDRDSDGAALRSSCASAVRRRSRPRWQCRKTQAVLIKQFIGWNDDALVLRQLNPDECPHPARRGRRVPPSSRRPEGAQACNRRAVSEAQPAIRRESAECHFPNVRQIRCRAVAPALFCSALAWRCPPTPRRPGSGASDAKLPPQPGRRTSLHGEPATASACVSEIDALWRGGARHRVSHDAWSSAEHALSTLPMAAAT